MFIMRDVFLLVFALSIGTVFTRDISYCAPGFSCGEMKNTMCLYPKDTPSNACGEIERANLTNNEKSELLALHNKIRNQLAMGQLEGRNGTGKGFFPPARNMRELEWSVALEDVALRWAYQCMGEKHDECRKINQSLFSSPGQNIIDFTEPEVGFPLTQWLGKVADFPIDMLDKPEKLNREADKMVARMLMAETSTLGCGRIVTISGNESKSHVVCNFELGGVLGGAPYQVGEPCSKCPGGRSCGNNGTGGSDTISSHLCAISGKKGERANGAEEVTEASLNSVCWQVSGLFMMMIVMFLMCFLLTIEKIMFDIFVVKK